MNIILLSGGSGKRLWPLSNDIRSKQFIKIFKNADGSYSSMIQRVYGQIRRVDPDAVVTIATAKSQVSSIHNQLDDNIGISVEPCRRDTFPAIALATLYLHEVQKVPLNEVVVVCPVDPYVQDDYFYALRDLGKAAEEGGANLVLMGIKPSYPSSKYGYIIPETNEEISKVSTFKEKPDEETAKKYISMGALWNGGVFAYKIEYLLNKAHELIDFTDYQDLYSKYETLEKISFDYAVVEKEQSIKVMYFGGQWKDLGTWNTLTDEMTEAVIGEGTIGEGCENTHIINELGIPVLAIGAKGLVIAASQQGILVADYIGSTRIKPYVDQMDQQIMFADKSWGTFEVLDVGENSLTVKGTLEAGQMMHYHSHQYRDEIWTIISGEGYSVVDGMEQPVKAGDVITMQAGCRHTIIARTRLTLIEVQLGKGISAKDKIKYKLEK